MGLQHASWLLLDSLMHVAAGRAVAAAAAAVQQLWEQLEIFVLVLVLVLWLPCLFQSRPEHPAQCHQALGLLEVHLSEGPPLQRM